MLTELLCVALLDNFYICRDKDQRSDGSEESEEDLRTCGRQVETELKAEAMDS